MSNPQPLVTLAVFSSALAPHPFVTEFLFNFKFEIKRSEGVRRCRLWNSTNHLKTVLPNHCDCDGAPCTGRPDLLVVLLDESPASMELGVEICLQVQSEKRVLVLAPTEEVAGSRKFSYLSSLVDQHQELMRLNFYKDLDSAFEILCRNLNLTRALKTEDTPLFSLPKTSGETAVGNIPVPVSVSA